MGALRSKSWKYSVRYAKTYDGVENVKGDSTKGRQTRMEIIPQWEFSKAASGADVDVSENLLSFMWGVAF
jgi:hypothetical protein